MAQTTFTKQATTTKVQPKTLSQARGTASFTKTPDLFTPRGSLFLDGVTVTFDNKIKALSSVQLAVEQGEIIFVTGASGAGKTTLLKVLSGDLAPSEGRIIRPSELFTAKVYQDLKLLNNLTLKENLLVSYDPAIYKNKRSFTRDIEELSRLLNIDRSLDIKATEANGGLRQKVAIIRALLSKPDILVADEPTSSLDKENSKRLFDLLNLYNTKKGMTVIWSTHNNELVKSFSGRIIHLDQGRLVYSGQACFI